MSQRSKAKSKNKNFADPIKQAIYDENPQFFEKDVSQLGPNSIIKYKGTDYKLNQAQNKLGLDNKKHIRTLINEMRSTVSRQKNDPEYAVPIGSSNPSIFSNVTFKDPTIEQIQQIYEPNLNQEYTNIEFFNDKILDEILKKDSFTIEEEQYLSNIYDLFGDKIVDTIETHDKMWKIRKIMIDKFEKQSSTIKPSASTPISQENIEDIGMSPDAFKNTIFMNLQQGKEITDNDVKINEQFKKKFKKDIIKQAYDEYESFSKAPSGSSGIKEKNLETPDESLKIAENMKNDIVLNLLKGNISSLDQSQKDFFKEVQKKSGVDYQETIYSEYEIYKNQFKKIQDNSETILRKQRNKEDISNETQNIQNILELYNNTPLIDLVKDSYIIDPDTKNKYKFDVNYFQKKSEDTSKMSTTITEVLNQPQQIEEGSPLGSQGAQAPQISVDFIPPPSKQPDISKVNEALNMKTIVDEQLKSSQEERDKSIISGGYKPGSESKIPVPPVGQTPLSEKIAEADIALVSAGVPWVGRKVVEGLGLLTYDEYQKSLTKNIEVDQGVTGLTPGTSGETPINTALSPVVIDSGEETKQIDISDNTKPVVSLEGTTESIQDQSNIDSNNSSAQSGDVYYKSGSSEVADVGAGIFGTESRSGQESGLNYGGLPDSSTIAGLEEEGPDTKMEKSPEVDTIPEKNTYDNAIHKNALLVFFGSYTNPAWNWTLFSEYNGIDYDANKRYFLNWNKKMFDKFSIELLIDKLMYNESSSGLDVFREYHEIMQLYTSYISNRRCDDPCGDCECNDGQKVQMKLEDFKDVLGSLSYNPEMLGSKGPSMAPNFNIQVQNINNDVKNKKMSKEEGKKKLKLLLNDLKNSRFKSSKDKELLDKKILNTIPNYELKQMDPDTIPREKRNNWHGLNQTYDKFHVDQKSKVIGVNYDAVIPKTVQTGENFQVKPGMYFNSARNKIENIKLNIELN